MRLIFLARKGLKKLEMTSFESSSPIFGVLTESSQAHRGQPVIIPPADERLSLTFSRPFELGDEDERPNTQLPLPE